MSYKIEVTSAARRDLAKLPGDVLHRIDAHILTLAENPHPAGAQKVQGSQFFRVRVGDYRILYMVESHRLVIVIVRVRHRRDVSRGL